MSLGRVRSLGHDSFLPDLLFTVPPLNDSSALFTVSLVFWPVNLNHVLHTSYSNAGIFFRFLSKKEKRGALSIQLSKFIADYKRGIFFFYGMTALRFVF